MKKGNYLNKASRQYLDIDCDYPESKKVYKRPYAKKKRRRLLKETENEKSNSRN